MSRLAMLILACMAVAGCKDRQKALPTTAGEESSGFSYIPVDPLPVSVVPKDGSLNERDQFPPGTTAAQMRLARYGQCVSLKKKTDDSADVMDALPDHTVRMAVRHVSGSGTGTYGPIALSAKGETYQVVIDSIIADIAPIRFGFRIGGGLSLSELPKDIPADLPIEVVRMDLNAKKDSTDPTKRLEKDFEIISVPVYVGVGARLTATVKTRSADLNLTNLLAVATSVEAGESSGSITVQTLGIYGQPIASAFPIPSELNTTSVQNALVSLGAIKAILYDGDTGARPRIIGIYNPLPTSDPDLINKIFAELANGYVAWPPCGQS